MRRSVLIHGVRISASIRETFRLRPVGGKAYGFQIMGQRDVNIKWIGEAAAKKEESDKEGLGADDGGVFFGWAVENAHLGKTEIFFDPCSRSKIGRCYYSLAAGDRLESLG